MKAVKVLGPDQLEVATIPEPNPGHGVLVRSRQVGICGTDIKILSGRIPVGYPRIMGHEMVGEVSGSAEGSPFKVGDRVLVDPGVACGVCDLCVAGRTNICRFGGLMGRDSDGVFTELVYVPSARLVPLPDSISRTASGLLQVLGTCIHAVNSIETVSGQVAAVIGLGVSGQLIAQLMTLRGMTVIGATRSEWKRAVALQCGVAMAVGPGDLEDAVSDATSGLGPDVVIEAVGLEATLAQSIELVKIGGEIVVFGTITSGNQGLPYYYLYQKELTLRNPRAAVIGDYAAGVALAADGVLHLEELVSHRLGLDEAARAFELVDDPSSLKVLMEV